MVIRKKDIKSVADVLSNITGPFSFYNNDGKLLYKSPAHTGDGKHKAIQIGDVPAGYIVGSADRLDDAAALLTPFIKNIEERKSLTAHTLHKYRELNFLSSLSEILSTSIDIDEILRSATVRVQEITGVENCSVMVINRHGNRFYLKAASGRIVNEESWLELSSGIAGRVVETGKSSIINKPENHPYFVNNGRVKINSMLCIPLRVKDKTVGILNLSNKSNGIFTTEDESLLVSISVMIAGAIATAHLLEEKIKNEKFATIGQMAAGIIHDIRNPLNNIKGCAELFGNVGLGLEERKEYSKLIIDEIGRLVRMIEGLIAFSREFETKLSIEKISLERFLIETVSYIEKEMSLKNIDVVLRLEYNDHLYIDPERFKRAIFNITGNARDAMRKGGRLLILTRANNNNVEMVFSDTGGGIPQDIMNKIFEPFVTKEKRSGMGLGLAITKEIVEEHGGIIIAANGNYSGIEGFNGANFIIRLPLHS